MNRPCSQKGEKENIAARLAMLYPNPNPRFTVLIGKEKGQIVCGPNVFLDVASLMMTVKRNERLSLSVEYD